MRHQAQMPAFDLDYIIMTNAHEESRLGELLADLKQHSPDLSEAEAKQLLKPRILQLVAQKRIGFYALDISRPTQGELQPRDLEVPRSLDLVDDDHTWAWTPPEGAPIYCLFAIDRAWWGEPHDT